LPTTLVSVIKLNTMKVLIVNAQHLEDKDTLICDTNVFKRYCTKLRYSVLFHRAVYNSERHNPNFHRCENIKYHTILHYYV
jgi:hypothetical protein